jgi:16S rRNA (uracil1498-N3)-methyltransferase
LVQALPKGKLFESIVQKATELGVSQIVPLLSERVVTHLDAKDCAHKTQKWQAVAVEAIKQCGSSWLPRVMSPVTANQLLKQTEECEFALVGSLQPGAQHPHECFRTFQSKHGRMPRSARIWIGPEGDFTPEELGAIQASGACPVSLGPLVLRTETAAIYCLSILNYELTSPSRD